MARPKNVEIQFVRDTRLGEDDRIHKAGSTLSVAQASADRWIRRGAAELATKTQEPPTEG